MGPLQADGGPSLTANKQFHDVVNALAAFTVCKDDPKFLAGAFKKITTFDISGLDYVMVQYENELARCTERGKIMMSQIDPYLQTSIMTSTMTALGRPTLASMLNHTAFLSTIAGVDKLIWSFHAMNTTFLSDILRLIHLFLVEKRWAFVDETFKVMNHELPADGQTPPPPAPPLFYREILSPPKCLVTRLQASNKMLDKLANERLSHERKFQGKMPEEKISKKKNMPKRKASAKPSEKQRFNREGKENVEELKEQSLHTTPLNELFAKANAQHDKAMVALKKYQTNLKEGIAMIQAFNASISTESSKPPPLPESLEHYGITTSLNQQGLPKALRQDLFDLQFVREYIRESMPQVDSAGGGAFKTICHWSRAGKECWASVKEHIYGMAQMREYEYCRNDHIASYVVARNLQRKLIRWVLENGFSHMWTPDVVQGLGMSGRSCAQVKADLRSEEGRARALLISVDECMAKYELKWAREAKAMATEVH